MFSTTFNPFIQIENKLIYYITIWQLQIMKNIIKKYNLENYELNNINFSHELSSQIINYSNRILFEHLCNNVLIITNPSNEDEVFEIYDKKNYYFKNKFQNIIKL